LLRVSLPDVPDLRRTALIVGAGAGITGDGLFLTALAWTVLETTGSPQQLSLVLLLLTVVPLVTAPLAGQLVDRPRAPDYLVGSEWLAALVLAGAAGWLSAFTPGLPFFLLVAAVVPAFGSLSGPALPIMLARLSGPGRVTGAMARAEVANRVGRVVGPLLGAALVAVGDFRLCCLANAASYLLSGLGWLIARGRLRAAAPEQGQHGRHGFTAGARYVLTHPYTRGLVAIALLANTAISVVTVTLPLLARGPLQAGAGAYGAMQAAFQVGMLLSAGLLSVRPLPDRVLANRRALGASLAGLGLAFGLLAASRTVPLAVGAVLLAGVALNVTALISDTRLVTEIPAAVQGRVMGLLVGMSGALRPAGTLAGGLVAGVFGAAAATGVGAAALTVLGGWYALRTPAEVAPARAGP
jgi:Major Facilitator Superfamily